MQQRHTAPQSHPDPRRQRHHTETVASQHVASGNEAEYRIDLERLRFSPFFGRLAAVTQVVPQSGVGPVMHNRLTHTLKVSAVARVIASRLRAEQASHERFLAGKSDTDSETGRIITALGGCDTIVSQAAAHAHDLGHPPFGHIGERVLDHLARTCLGLAEGFEGNAQTFRIITELDTLGRPFGGLNLTAAVRASVLKYPWLRSDWSAQTLAELPLAERPRGVGDTGFGAQKFSIYELQQEEAEEALAAFPGIAQHHQTVDCAIMDIADDIAYAVHDLDDFTRAGVLQYAPVSAELRGWLNGSGQESGHASAPGSALETLWRSLREKDSWIADRDAFQEAVVRVNAELVDGLLARPYDGSIDAERAVSSFTRKWIERLRDSVEVREHPAIRGGHVQLGVRAWHEVAVLKFVHSHFVLRGPDLVLEQRGNQKLIADLVLAFDEWLADPIDAKQAPIRLREDIEEVTQQLVDLRRRTGRAAASAADVKRAGRSRAILDYVSALTDQQAVVAHAQLTRGFRF